MLLDSELATLYGVTTKRFNEQVKRNVARFPADFMFRLSADEASALRSQSATGYRYVAHRIATTEVERNVTELLITHRF